MFSSRNFLAPSIVLAAPVAGLAQSRTCSDGSPTDALFA